MTITTKVEFIEQSKVIVTSVKIESDTLTPEEVVNLTKETFVKAFDEGKKMQWLKAGQ
jgi:hypothetical protein